MEKHFQNTKRTKASLLTEITELKKKLLALVPDLTTPTTSVSQLPESEYQFRFICDASPVLLWQSGIDTLCNYFNKTWLDFTGRSLEQEMGNGWAEGVYPADLDQCLQIYLSSFKLMLPFKIVYRLKRADGEFRWLLDNGVPRFNSNGEFIGYAGYCIDITDVHIPKERISNTNAFKRPFIEASADAKVTIGIDGKITDVNYATEKITGIPRDTLIGTNLSDYFTNQSNAIAGYQYVLHTGKIRDYPLTLRHTNGHTTDILYNATVYENEDGTMAGVFVIAHDITEQKNAVLTLQESEIRFKTIFNQSPLGIAVIDSLSGHIYEVNPQFASIAGSTIDEMANINWMKITHPDDIQKDLDNMALLNANKIPGFTMVKRYIRPDDTIVWINMTIVPMKNEDNSHPRHLCMIEDITEKIEQEKKISKAIIKAQEDERNEIGSELHDNVCQILAACQMSLGMLKGSIPESKITYYTQCYDDLKLAANDVRDLSHHLAPPFLKDSTLEEVFKRMIYSFNIHKKIDIQIKFSKNFEKSPLSMDFQQTLYRIMQEHMKNIMAHAQATVIKINVSIVKKIFTLQVTDNGIGFDTSLISEGIGITNMRRRVELYAGKFLLESSVNKGCNMLITIPLTDKRLMTNVEQ